MWLAAFSSSSVSKKTVSSAPMRPSPSTSATSPSRAGALVARRVGAQDLGVLVGVDPDRAPVAELDLEARG